MKRPRPPALDLAAFQAAVALHQRGRLAEAEAAYDALLARAPGHADLVHARGLVALQQRRSREAVQWLERAAAAAPHAPHIRTNLAVAYSNLGELGRAQASCRAALAIAPRWAPAHTNLAADLVKAGRVDEAIGHYEQALALEPEPPLMSALVYAHSFVTDDGTRLRAVHDRFGAAYGAPPLQPVLTPQADPGRPLRVGLVSPDLRSHAVACFVRPLLRHRDRDRIAIVAFAGVVAPDAVTEELRSACDGWISTVGLSDAQLAERIAAERIDIVLDLAGHTDGNRLPALARRPAPLVGTWLGYPATTGLGRFDFRLTDAQADPPGETEAFHAERLIRLPRPFLCFSPLAEIDPTPEPPSARGASPTFGSFNNLAKVSAEVVETWSAVLASVPGSRLYLKSPALRDPDVCRDVTSRFARHGVAPDRLRLEGWLPSAAAHLAAYADVDVALDTFPYAGTTTTCEALWMGVPVVTLAGRLHAGRVGVSLLADVFPEGIAPDRETYVARAAALASDLPALIARRQSLRPALAAAPLGDGAGFARAFEAALRELWVERAAPPPG